MAVPKLSFLFTLSILGMLWHYGHNKIVILLFNTINTRNDMHFGHIKIIFLFSALSILGIWHSGHTKTIVLYIILYFINTRHDMALWPYQNYISFFDTSNTTNNILL